MQMFLAIILFMFFPVFQSQCSEHHSPFPGSPFIKNYTSNNIGGGPQVWNCIQDHRGMIYVCDMGGIIEFNGREWKRIDNANYSIVRHMAIDSPGRIYAGCSDDFGYLQPDHQGRMKFVSLAQPVFDQKIKFQDIWRVLSTKHGIYFCSNKYVFRYFKKEVTTIPVDFYVQDAYLINDQIYLPTHKGIIQLCDTSQVLISKKIFFDITPWKGAEFLGINFKGQLITFHLQTGDSNLFQSPVQDLLKLENPTGIYRIDKDLFAITTEKNRVIVLSNDGKIIQMVNSENGLMNGSLYHLFVDRDKNIWACMSRGIAKIDIGFPVHKFGEKQNITTNVLSSCTFNGRLYVGTVDGIYYLPDFNIQKPDECQRFVKITTDAPECWEFKVFKDQLFALCGMGLWVINGTKAQLIYEIRSPQKAHCINSSPLFPDVLFLGMRGKLIGLKLDRCTGPGKFKIVRKFDFPEITEKIRKIVVDKNGDLWLNTQYSGVYFLRFLNNDITNYKATLLGKRNGINAITETRSHLVGQTIVLATDSGLIQPGFPSHPNDPDSLIRFRYSTVFGDSISEPLSYIEKIDEKKYLLSGHGLYYAFLNGGRKAFDSCGFNRLDFIIESISKGNDSIINICSPDGFFFYDTKNHRNFNQSFNTIISSVKLSNDSVLFGGTFYSWVDSSRIASLKQSKDMIPSINYQDNSVSFHFSALFYEDPELTRFQRQLVGFDKKWSNWLPDCSAEYTNLGEGQYTFRVKARNVYGVISNIAEYSFTIKPPWYRSWWAYFLYTLLSAGVIYLAARLYTVRLKHQKYQLELIVKERTAEIEEQANELKLINEKLMELGKFKQGITSMIIHDLKNPVNAIIHTTDKNPHIQLERIKQSGKQMLNMILNILDVAKYEEARIQLSIENYNLLDISSKAIDQIQFLSNEKNISIKNNIDPKLGFRGDAEIVERIFVNLLTNAIKFTPNNGKIIINAQPTSSQDEKFSPEEFIGISITDDGIGIEANKIHLVFQKFGQVVARNSGSVRSTGLGLTFCKMATEAHGGKIGIRSTPNKGSTFWFTLPVAQEITNYSNLNSGINSFKPAELSETGKKQLSTYLERLHKTEFYKVTEIFAILDEIDDLGNNEIKIWKQALMIAIDTGNEILYKKLL